MILVHFHQAFRTTTPASERLPGEWLVGWIVWWGLEGKSAAAFAFLFGAGFAILIRSAAAKGIRPTGFFVRRMAALAVIGLFVEVFTGFVILVPLAISGALLLLVRGLATGALFGLAMAAVLAVPLSSLATALQRRSEAPAATTPVARPAVKPPASYGEVVSRRADRVRQRYLSWWSLLPTSTLALLIFGLLSVRHGIIDSPRQHRRLIAGVMAYGALCWTVYWLVLPKMPESWYAWSPHAQPIRYGLGVLDQQWLGLTYIGGLLLLLAYYPRWIRTLAGFGTVGRMALTNYVLQAALIAWLSSPFGLALTLRPYYYVAAAAVLFALLVLVSTAWLARFAYGPLEWVWRAITYLRVPPLRHARPVVRA